MVRRQGQIQDFQLGRAQKIMCTHADHRRKARSPFTDGLQAALKGPGSSRVFYALSCYLSLIFKHSDTKWPIKSVNHNLGGGGGEAPAVPPLDPPPGGKGLTL